MKSEQSGFMWYDSVPVPRKEIGEMVSLYSTNMRLRELDHTRLRVFSSSRLNLNPRESSTRNESSQANNSLGLNLSMLSMSLASFHMKKVHSLCIRDQIQRHNNHMRENMSPSSTSTWTSTSIRKKKAYTKLISLFFLHHP